MKTLPNVYHTKFGFHGERFHVRRIQKLKLGLSKVFHFFYSKTSKQSNIALTVCEIYKKKKFKVFIFFVETFKISLVDTMKLLSFKRFK